MLEGRKGSSPLDCSFSPVILVLWLARQAAISGDVLVSLTVVVGVVDVVLVDVLVVVGVVEVVLVDDVVLVL